MSFWDAIAKVDASLSETNYYELLSVPETATGAEIQERFYKLAGKFHPDRYALRANKEQLAALSRIYARLGEARKILLGSERKAYDEGLKSGKTRFSPSAAPKLSTQDPSHPMAKGLYEKAQKQIAEGNPQQALSNLKLAKQYDKNSVVIAEALAKLEEDKGGKGKKNDEPKEAPQVPTQSASTQAETEPAQDEPAEPESVQPESPSPKTSQTDNELAPPSAPESASPKPVPEPSPSQRPEQRGEPRYAKAMPVRIRVPSWERFEMLYTRDISRGGMFLKTSADLPVGTPICVHLIPPTGPTIELDARVQHVRDGDNGQSAGVGLKFDEVNPEIKAQLETLFASNTPAEPAITLETLVSELVRLRSLSPHEILGTNSASDKAEIRKAYEAQVRKFHPNAAGYENDPAMIDIGRELITCIRKAYEDLSKG